jgi:hypothetical protein
MTSKYKPIFAVYKVYYMNREDPSSDIVVREVVKAFETESEAYQHVRSGLFNGAISQDELNQGWDLQIDETTIEALWAEIELSSAMDK